MQILTNIYIYPIKSIPATSLKKSDVVKQGLAFDGLYMLVDSTGKLISNTVSYIKTH
ncbi:MOSC domain-containing protein [Psychromonas sp. CD1]|uniref:MOSC domain-containing protein n=1 Tax=Psychromonas sp. CD1 TaxID=1979839 RepID=UPI002150CD9A|nr:MOSC domain-containing protein [Psychromonas sp. CD1]